MNDKLTPAGLFRALSMGAAALAIVLAPAPPAAADAVPDANGEISQHALLGAMQIRSDDVDLEKDLVCLHNSGPTGTWTGGPFTLAFAVLPDPGVGYSKDDLIVGAPAEVDFRVESQESGWIVRLEPHGGSMIIEAGSRTCFGIQGVDLDDRTVVGIGKGGPLAERPTAR